MILFCFEIIRASCERSLREYCSDPSGNSTQVGTGVYLDLNPSWNSISSSCLGQKVFTWVN